MRKYGYILLLVGLIILATGFGMFLFDTFDSSSSENNSEHNKEIVENDFDENYIDRSLEEKQIRESTGNSYYTINTSLKLSENRVYDILQITNSRLVRIDKEWYSFSCTLTNTSSIEYSSSTFEIEFLNKKGGIISKEEAFITSIAPGMTGTLSVTTKNNILNAYDFKINRTEDYIPVPKDSYDTQE